MPLDELFLYPNAGPVIVLGCALVALVVVLAGCAWLTAALRRGATADWDRRRCRFVRNVCVALSIAVLVLPSVACWIGYHVEYGNVDLALTEIDYDLRAISLERSRQSAFTLSATVAFSQLVLLIPCSVLAGLALSVARSHDGRDGGAS